jgi:pimeloyl-ACP methyl ester carboxylesterase
LNFTSVGTNLALCMFRQLPYAAARRSGKANEGGQREQHRDRHEREPRRACGDQKEERMNATKGDYAEVNGLRMYYEVHGSGRPLVLLHGAYMTVDAMWSILPGLAETRQVIAAEMQAHGRTADIDRPITYEGMADDVAALLRHLGIDEADVFGFSMGGGVALQLAIRHPGLVRRLVVASASYTSDGMQPELHEMIPTITPEMFAGSPMEAAYQELAPNPADFPTLVEKMKRLDVTPFAWPAEDVRGIEAPTMIVVGDADAIRLEHAVELFRLLGGGAMGDLSGFSGHQLVVLPGTSHFIPPGSGVMDRAEWLLAMIPPFLDAPVKDADHQRLSDPVLAHLAVGQPADQRCRDGPSHADQDAYDHQSILTAYRKCVTSGE